MKLFGALTLLHLRAFVPVEPATDAARVAIELATVHGCQRENGIFDNPVIL